MVITKDVLESDAVSIPVGMLAFTYGKHLPSIMVALGACAGLSAQLAVWTALVQPQGRDPGDFLANGRTKAGKTFIFGDAVNHFLWATYPERLSFVSTAASGIASTELPDFAELARYVVSTMTNEAFGVPRYPRPGEYADLPQVALGKVFPDIARQFEQDGYSAANWPALLGVIAWRIMDAKREQLKPAHALAMLMESAVPMSRIDPTTVEHPRFDIDWKLQQRWGNRAMTSGGDQQPQLFEEIRSALPFRLVRPLRHA